MVQTTQFLLNHRNLLNEYFNFVVDLKYSLIALYAGVRQVYQNGQPIDAFVQLYKALDHRGVKIILFYCNGRNPWLFRIPNIYSTKSGNALKNVVNLY